MRKVLISLIIIFLLFPFKGLTEKKSSKELPLRFNKWHSYLQNDIFILTKFTPRKLGNLLSFQQRNLQSKLAVVSARPVFIRRTVFTVLKNTNKHIKDHPQDSCLACLSHWFYLFILYGHFQRSGLDKNNGDRFPK
jgi:hypothetical protein